MLIFGVPLSLVLSPLLRRGARKKNRAPENFRTPRKLLWIEVRMGTDGMRRAKASAILQKASGSERAFIRVYPRSSKRPQQPDSGGVLPCWD